VAGERFILGDDWGLQDSPRRERGLMRAGSCGRGEARPTATRLPGGSAQALLTTLKGKTLSGTQN